MNIQEFLQRYQYDVRKDRIGGGSFGTVYKAYDSYLHEEVAIKVGAVQYFQGKEFSLRSEVEAAQSLPDHPNIAHYKKVYQFEMPNGLFDYAIMKYYPHGNLSNLIAAATLRPEQKKDIAHQLIRGIHHLHTNGVVHRDLKPSNILIYQQASNYIPLVADFGLSKLASPNQAQSKFSNSFEGGTLEYSSPEQLKGLPLKHNTDLWALGLILIELFSGNHPMADLKTASTEARRQAIFQQILHDDLSIHSRSLPAPFNNIVAQCLVKDPSQRLASLAPFVETSHSAQVPLDQPTTIQPQKNKTAPPQAPLSPHKAKQGNPPSRKRLTLGLPVLLALFLGAWWFWPTDSIHEDRQPSVDPLVSDTTAPAQQPSAEPTVVNQPVQPPPTTDPSKAATDRQQADQSAWASAQRTNTIRAYETYLSDYPQGQYRSEAQRAIRDLEAAAATAKADQSAWASAKRTNTIRAYESYLSDYPQGQYRSDAQKAIRDIEAATAAAAAAKTDPFAANMVRVAGGTFTMGCQDGRDTDCYDWEKPTHEVKLSSFSLSKYEVTQAQWRAVMGNNPSYNKSCDQCPVEQVSWDDIQNFLRKLNAQTGQNYRLPTEAEWEYAARGGNSSRGFLYSGSNTIGDVAWYSSNAKQSNTHGSEKTTRPVGGRKPNELGLYDMSGNVWEWCSDWYGTYSGSAQTNPKGPSSGASRVGRGGSWNRHPQYCRAAHRGYLAPALRSYDLGFRLARS